MPISRNLVQFLRLNIYIFFAFFSEECSNKGGTNGGSCASGFGVCCICKHFHQESVILFSSVWQIFKHRIQGVKFTTGTYTCIPCKLLPNFCFMWDFPQSLHVFNFASCFLLVAITVYFSPKVPQLARFMCTVIKFYNFPYFGNLEIFTYFIATGN